MDKKLNDIDLRFGPAIRNLDKATREAIVSLRQANETRLLQNLMHQNISIAPIDTCNLIIPKEEAVEWLRDGNEQKLLQKLANSERSLLLPDLDGLSSQLSIALQNLAYAYETRILVSIAYEPPTLHNPDLAIFGHEADIAIRSLRSTNGFQILQNLSRSPTAIKLPRMAPLESTCARARTLLRNVNEVRLMQKLGRQRARFCLPELSGFAVEARILNSRIRSAQEAKIIAVVCKREQKREKIIQQCFLHAEWAGSDLERWDRLFAEYTKYPKRLKILTGLIEDAHSRFLGILAETRKMSEIQDRCGHNPILLREFEILKDEIARYKASQAELEKQEGVAEDADMSLEQEDEGQNASINESSMRM